MTDENQEVVTPKSKKGKNKEKKEKKRSLEDDEPVQKKKSKKQKKSKEDTSMSEQVEAEDVDEALGEDVDEDAQTEVVKKKPSKRQLKKEKAEKREAEVKEASKMQAIGKALNYVSKWKHARSEWKFEKVKQIWLINNLLNDAYIPDEHFPTVLEYFEGCKGQARKQLVDKAMKVIKKAEDIVEKDEEVTETTEYKRARELLQALPTET